MIAIQVVGNARDEALKLRLSKAVSGYFVARNKMAPFDSSRVITQPKKHVKESGVGSAPVFDFAEVFQRLSYSSDLHAPIHHGRLF